MALKKKEANVLKVRHRLTEDVTFANVVETAEGIIYYVAGKPLKDFVFHKLYESLKTKEVFITLEEFEKEAGFKVPAGREVFNANGKHAGKIICFDEETRCYLGSNDQWTSFPLSSVFTFVKINTTPIYR